MTQSPFYSTKGHRSKARRNTNSEILLSMLFYYQCCSLVKSPRTRERGNQQHPLLFCQVKKTFSPLLPKAHPPKRVISSPGLRNQQGGLCSVAYLWLYFCFQQPCSRQAVCSSPQRMTVANMLYNFSSEFLHTLKIFKISSETTIEAISFYLLHPQ